MMQVLTMWLALVASLAMCASSQGQDVEAVAAFGPETAATKLLVRGTTDLTLFGPVLEAFLSTRPGLSVDYEQWGSNDLAALSAAECTDGLPDADLVISSAVDLQVQFVNDGCANRYQSDMTSALPASRRWRYEIFGITEEPAVLIYNTELVSAEEAPNSRFDLIDLLRPDDSRFEGKVATYDIEDSGLGYLFDFTDSLQANTFGRLLEAFGRSRAVATCCSAEIIEAVARGDYLIGYNVLGSYALARAEKDKRIGVRAMTDYTLVLSRAAVIPKQARQPALAGELIDFMLSPTGIEVLTRSRLIVRVGSADASDADLPGGGPSTLRTIALSPTMLAGLDRHKRMIFLEQWRENLDRQ